MTFKSQAKLKKKEEFGGIKILEPITCGGQVVFKKPYVICRGGRVKSLFSLTRVGTAVAKKIHTLITNPYVNEVNLRRQKPPLKCCQPLDFLCDFLKGLDLSMLKIWSLQVKGLQNYQLSKLEVSTKVCQPAPAPVSQCARVRCLDGLKSFSKFDGW